MPGPPSKLTVEEAVGILRDADRPVWSAKQLAERADVSRPTAGDRLQEAVDRGKIATIKIGNGTGYYLPGKEMKRFEEGDSAVGEGLRAFWTDRFVGDQREPSTVQTMERETLTAGDRVKFLVMGWPGDWGMVQAVAVDESVWPIDPPPPEGYTGTITGELYAKPTVPIEHIQYPDDYDLELNVGGEYTELQGRDHTVLMAGGVRNYWIRPCNDALFLSDVQVENIDGPGPKDITKFDVSERLRDSYLPTQLRNDSDGR